MDADREMGTKGRAQVLAAVALRVDAASQDYRTRLYEKAGTMRAAVLDGETTDARVLAVAEALERLAGNED